MSVKVIPITDAYRAGYEGIDWDSGGSLVRPMEVGFEGSPGDGIGRFPAGMSGPVGFVLPMASVKVIGRMKRMRDGGSK